MIANKTLKTKIQVVIERVVEMEFFSKISYHAQACVAANDRSLSTLDRNLDVDKRMVSVM
jgi:hypothetical protein